MKRSVLIGIPLIIAIFAALWPAGRPSCRNPWRHPRGRRRVT